MNVEYVLKTYNIKILRTKEVAKGYSSKKSIIFDDKNKGYLIKKLEKKLYNNFPFALEVQNKLKNETPKIVKTKNNKLFVSDSNCIFYITELFKTYKHDYTAYEIGEYLGYLHSIMEKIIFTDKVTFIKYENNLNIINNLLQKKQNERVIGILKYKKNILKKLRVDDIDFSKLKLQVIHGDFYIDNLIYTSSGLKIVDFDQCCTFYREYEMLRGFFISLYNSTKTKSENLGELINYIKGYKKNICNIDGINAYKLYLYIQANSLSGIIGKTNDMNFAEKKYNILTFLVENNKEIVEIINEH